MKKRIFCFLCAFLLSVSLLVQLVPVSRAATYILDPSQASGSSYCADYAAKLDAIFQGDAILFSNTNDTFPLGTSLNVKKSYCIANNTYSGYQCYIYAQAVYYYLFGDVPRHGEGSLFWSDSKKVLTNETVASYELFSNADVGFGAYIRTTTNSDGSYNGNGHSMIVLSYDQTGITYLEGNADGRGLVRVTVRTWDEFNSNQLTAKGRRIGCVVQCKSAMCLHEYDVVGTCTACFKTFDFAATFSAACAGTYTVCASDGISLHSQAPYIDASVLPEYIQEGEAVEVLGSVTNAFGEVWYQVSCDGTVGYTTPDNLTWAGLGEQEITCTVTSPAEGEVVPKASFPVIGTVTSKYPLKEITAYLDGQLYATVDPENATTVNLRSTAVNQDLSFSTLASGSHTLTIMACDIHHDPVTVCTRNFVTEGAADDTDSDEAPAPDDTGGNGTLLPGDMDGDGSGTTDDAVYLLLHIMFGPADYPIDSAADTDLDGSGTTDTDDAVYLLLHVMFGAEDYPLA